MIYVNGLEGRKGYQKLHNVLNFDIKIKSNREGFENFGKTVDEKYKTFADEMRKKQTKKLISPKSIILFLILENEKFRDRAFSTSSIQKNIFLRNPTIIQPVCKSYLNLVIEERSKENMFLKSFKKAILQNTDIVGNSKNLLNEINKNFKENNYSNPTKSIVNRLNMKELNCTDNQNKSNFNKENFKSLKNEEEKYFKFIKRRMLTKDTKEDFILENGNKKNGIYLYYLNSDFSKKSPNFDYKNKRKNIKKLEKCLISSLVYLYNNDVQLNTFFEKNPFAIKPFHLPFSNEFFDAVKFDDTIKVQNFVSRDNRYLMVVDYFFQTSYHWAAKRGYNEMMKILIKNGNKINQTDPNSRTPLWHAAKNNHYQSCQILLEENANPFIESKCGKKPIDITTDPHIRKLLNEYMEKLSYMNEKNYFLTKVAKNSISIINKHLIELVKK